jgi:hypothetical protein
MIEQQQRQEVELPKDSLNCSKGSQRERVSKPRAILKQTSSRSMNAASSSSLNNSVRFSSDVDVVAVPKFPIEEFSNLFYELEEIAQFRHDAWCEECGFDPAEFQ